MINSNPETNLDRLWNGIDRVITLAFPYLVCLIIGTAFGYSWCWFALGG